MSKQVRFSDNVNNSQRLTPKPIIKAAIYEPTRSNSQTLDEYNWAKYHTSLEKATGVDQDELMTGPQLVKQLKWGGKKKTKRRKSKRNTKKKTKRRKH